MDLINPNIGLVVWTSIAFLTLLFFLTKFAWKPILSALKERETSIEKALSAADAAKLEMEQLSSKNEKLLLEAKAERDALMKQARESADQLVAEAKDAAVEEGKKLIEKAQAAIETEKKAAVEQLKAQAALLSIEVAEKVLRKELGDKSSQDAYAKELVGSSDLSQL